MNARISSGKLHLLLHQGRRLAGIRPRTHKTQRERGREGERGGKRERERRREGGRERESE
jgi:hypothetical protein